MIRTMHAYLSSPRNVFICIDMALVLVVYALSLILFLSRKRGSVAPILFFGMFLFPVQFGIWFLASKVNILVYPNLNFFELFYLLFLKFCLIASILAPKT